MLRGRELGSRPFHLEEPAAKDLYPATFIRHAFEYKQRLDEVMARSESHGRAAVIDWVDATPGMRILDVACGPGTLSDLLAGRVSPDGEVVGIDLAAGMIELARQDCALRPPGAVRADGHGRPSLSRCRFSMPRSAAMGFSSSLIFCAR